MAEEARLVVAIRPRPLAAGEEADATLSFEAAPANAVLMAAAPGGGAVQLPFDRVFSADTCNAEVYSALALPIVQAALRGVNGAVAAYGQTGSGKTRTMRGTAEDAGLVQRVVRGGGVRRRSRRRQRAESGACCHCALARPLTRRCVRLRTSTRTRAKTRSATSAWACSTSRFTTARPPAPLAPPLTPL